MLLVKLQQKLASPEKIIAEFLPAQKCRLVCLPHGLCQILVRKIANGCCFPLFSNKSCKGKNIFKPVFKVATKFIYCAAIVILKLAADTLRTFLSWGSKILSYCTNEQKYF